MNEATASSLALALLRNRLVVGAGLQTKVSRFRVCSLSVLPNERRRIPYGAGRSHQPYPEIICWTRGSHRRPLGATIKTESDTAGPGWGLRICISHKVLGCDAAVGTAC